MVFPEGIVVDTKNRRYLTSKVNSLFLLKSRFIGDYEGVNKKLPTKNDEESYLVAGVGLSSIMSTCPRLLLSVSFATFFIVTHW